MRIETMLDKRGYSMLGKAVVGDVCGWSGLVLQIRSAENLTHRVVLCTESTDRR